MRRDKAEVALEILELAEEEGEDLSLRELYEESGLEPPEELGELLEFPPRIVLARLARDPAWSQAVRKACELYLELRLRGPS